MAVNRRPTEDPFACEHCGAAKSPGRLCAACVAAVAFAEARRTNYPTVAAVDLDMGGAYDWGIFNVASREAWSTWHAMTAPLEAFGPMWHARTSGWSPRRTKRPERGTEQAAALVSLALTDPDLFPEAELIAVLSVYHLGRSIRWTAANWKPDRVERCSVQSFLDRAAARLRRAQSPRDAATPARARRSRRCRR